MSLSELYVPYESLYGRVLIREAGVLRVLAHDYFQGLKDTYPENQTVSMPYKDLYFPQYPFRTSFTEALLIQTEVANKSNYMMWVANHLDDMDGDTELPIFMTGHTFNNFCERRLRPCLKNWIYPNQFQRYKNKPILLFQDHCQCLVLRSMEDLNQMVIFEDKETGDLLLSVPAYDHVPTYQYERRMTRFGRFLEEDLDSPYLYHIGNMKVYGDSDVTYDTIQQLIKRQIARGYTTIDLMPWL